MIPVRRIVWTPSMVLITILLVICAGCVPAAQQSAPVAPASPASADTAKAAPTEPPFVSELWEIPSESGALTKTVTLEGSEITTYFRVSAINKVGDTTWVTVGEFLYKNGDKVLASAGTYYIVVGTLLTSPRPAPGSGYDVYIRTEKPVRYMGSYPPKSLKELQGTPTPTAGG